MNEKLLETYEKLTDSLTKSNESLQKIVDTLEPQVEQLQQSNREMNALIIGLQNAVNKLIGKYGEEAQEIVKEQLQADGFKLEETEDEQ